MPVIAVVIDRLDAFDLARRLANRVVVGLVAGGQRHLPVQLGVDQIVIFMSIQAQKMRVPRRAFQVRGVVRHHEIFSDDEFRPLPHQDRVPKALHERASGQRQLHQKAVQLVGVFRHLDRQLIVHVILDAVRLRLLLRRRVTEDLCPDRAVWRKQLLHGARLEIHAGLRQHRVNDV